MIELTQIELERIIYLKDSGYPDQEILENINKKRKAEEEGRAIEVNYYIGCVLEQEE